MKIIDNMIWRFKQKRSLLLSSYCYSKGFTKLPYPPLEVFIEPTNFCNLKCIICPHGSGLKREKGFMDLNNFKNILDQVAGAGASKVTLNFAGEPLMNKNILEMIALAKANRLYARLHTNASFLTEDYSKKIIDSGLDEISFSFDDPRKDIYEKIRVNASYDKTLANIIGFLKSKKASGAKKPFTIVQRIILKDFNDFDQKDGDYDRLFSGLPVDKFHTIFAHNWAGNCPEYIEKDKYRSGKSPCRAIWQRLVVGWDGKVFACCNEMNGKLTIGDLNKTALLDIWNGPRMTELRNLMIKGRYDDVEACKDCDVLVRSKLPKMNIVKESAAKVFLFFKKDF